MALTSDVLGGIGSGGVNSGFLPSGDVWYGNTQNEAVTSNLAALIIANLPNDIVYNDKTTNIIVGYTVTPNNIGNITTGTVTLNPAKGQFQYLTNNGAFTLAAPTADSSIALLVTNGPTAGNITFSGYTVGGNTGSSLTTANGSKFMIQNVRVNGTSTYTIYALQ